MASAICPAPMNPILVPAATAISNTLVLSPLTPTTEMLTQKYKATKIEATTMETKRILQK
jgi:hypothetical protein